MFDPFNMFDPFGAGRRRINPASVFLPGDVGFVYDTQNLQSMFQDVAGTVPANQPGHPVGLRLDTKHGLGLGPELRGDGVVGLVGAAAVATYNPATGVGTATRVDASNQSWVYIAAPVGVTYAVDMTLISGFMTVRANGAGGAILNAAWAGTQTQILFVPSGTGIYLASGTAGTVSFTVNSIRDLPGIHATQSVAASRPTLARRPASGVRNLLTFTEQFDNAAWVKTFQNSATAPVVTPDFAAAPNGDLTAERVQFARTGTATIDRSRLEQTSIPVSAGATYTVSVWLKSATGSNQTLTIYLNMGSVLPSAVTVTSEWQRFVVSGNSGVSTTGQINIGLGYVANSVTTADVLVWGAQLELGATATAYQRVESVYDVTEAGQPDRWCLVTDGVDDGMVTPTITPAVGADKVQVVAGVRKSTSHTGLVVEYSAEANTNAGTFYMFSNLGNYLAKSRGSLTAGTATVAAPVVDVAVITMTGDIAADGLSIARNGGVPGTSPVDQGTGQFGTYPAYLYRRGGTTQPGKIEDCGMICRISTTNLTAAQIVLLETWANQRTGAY